MQSGLFLAFEPVATQAGDINSYRIHLINKTLWKVVFDGFMYIGDNNQPLSDSVDSKNTISIGYLPKQNLNDYPEFKLTLWRWTTEGQDGRMVKKLKIKPKQFFNKATYSPYLNADVHLYKIADDFAAPAKRGDSLSDYTQQNMPDESLDTFDQIQIELFDVEARANFPESIDLHIHKLTKDHEKLNPEMSMRLQLQSFEKYLSDAILVGVPYVYIIHGKGKGKLRDEIHQRLKANPNVLDFDNGYHEGYGAGGATKVIL